MWAWLGNAGRIGRLRRQCELASLMERYHPRFVLAMFNLISGFVSISLISFTAVLSHAPFIFPSAGATAFLLFSAPMTQASFPRSIVVGHAVGLVVGWLCLVGFGLPDAAAGDVLLQMTWSRALAAGLALGITSAILVLLRAPHPPAGATALIVALGLLPELWELGVMMLAVLLLVGQAVAINRFFGVNYPLWTRRHVPLR